jgi:hypothetical protein
VLQYDSIICHEGTEGEWRYCCTLSLTSVLDGGGWLTPRRGHFSPQNDPQYPLHRRLVGHQGRSGRVRKISPPQAFHSRTIQCIASRYTDYAIPAHACSGITYRNLWVHCKGDFLGNSGGNHKKMSVYKLCKLIMRLPAFVKEKVLVNNQSVKLS